MNINDGNKDLWKNKQETSKNREEKTSHKKIVKFCLAWSWDF